MGRVRASRKQVPAYYVEERGETPGSVIKHPPSLKKGSLTFENVLQINLLEATNQRREASEPACNTKNQKDRSGKQPSFPGSHQGQGQGARRGPGAPSAALQGALRRLPWHFEDYRNYSTETLLFIFYYMQHTRAQLLAAEALTDQRWTFHTKYLLWFRRNDLSDKYTMTESYETGDYEFFDAQEWRLRVKRNFTFDYKYLKSRPVVPVPSGVLPPGITQLKV